MTKGKITEPARESLSTRLDDEMVARIDSLRPLLSTRWHEATRSEVIRALVDVGLEELERRLAAGKTLKPLAALHIGPRKQRRR